MGQRVLLVGDSITLGYPPKEGPGFREWLRLAMPDDAFVGPFDDPKGSGLRHGGVGGATTDTFLLDEAPLLTHDGWLVKYAPDVVRLQIGTNDLTGADRIESIVDRVLSIVATGATRLPTAHWTISSVPLGGPKAFQDRVRAFNAMLLDQVTSKGVLRETAPHASFRDNYHEFNAVFDKEGGEAILTPPPDFTHLSARGYALSAKGIIEQWGRPVSNALRAASRGDAAGPGPGTNPPPPPSPPAKRGGGGFNVWLLAGLGLGALIVAAGRRGQVVP